MTLRSRSAEGHWLYGVYHFAKGDYARAGEEYLLALRYDKSFHRAHNALGVLTLTDGGPPEEAVEYFQKAIELDESFVGSYVNLGNAYRRMEQFDAAIEILDKAREIEPEDISVLNNLALAHRDKGQLEQAEKWLRKATEINPTDPLLFTNLGNVQYQQCKLGAAEKSLLFAISLGPEDPIPYLALGLVYFESGDRTRATTMHDKASAMDPITTNESKLHEALHDPLYEGIGCDQ